MINVGFIGCGRIADLHYLKYQQHPEAKLYAVCDTDAEIASARKIEWHAEKSYTDYRELLADKNIDAVEILAPHHNYLHEKLVIAAAQAGKHIAVQKPMTTDLASADRMLAAVKNSGRIYKVTENYIFYPPIIAAKKMIENGDIGEPLNLRIKCISGTSGGWEVPSAAWEWRMSEILAGRGTATFDHGHHLWATAWYLFGKVEKIKGWIDQSQEMVDSPALFIWKYRDSNHYGTCEFAHASDLHIPSKYYANDEWIEITGSRGIIFIRRCTGDIHDGPVLTRFDGKKMHEYELESDWAAGFRGATENFINAILGNEAPHLSGAEAREVLRFSLAAQKAARSHREIFLDELESNFPRLFAWRKRASTKRRSSSQKDNFLSRIFKEDLSKYAPQARTLTEQLVESFDPAQAKGWDLTIGIHLTADGGVAEEKIVLVIKDQKLNLTYNQIADDPTFTVRMSAGVWAAILLRKKRPEIAFLQGKIKVAGQAEEGLKLKAIFKL